MNPFYKLLLLTGGVLFKQSIQAQPADSTLDPVIITASLIPRPLSQTGRSVFTINGEELARLPVHSVDELLRYIPGVEVQMRGPMGAQSDVVMRGGTFQQVLVILDGVRLNDANTGHFNTYIPVAPAEIERIEVVKGASSALYGSEAVGGVIQIITKTFAAQKKPRREVQAKISGGAYGLATADIGGLYSTDKTAVGAGFLSNNAAGQQQRGNKGYVHAHTASVSVSHNLNKHWQLAVRSAYDSRSFAAQNFYTTALSDTAVESVATFWNSAAIRYHSDKHIVNITTSYKWLKDSFVFNKVTPANNNRSHLFQAMATDEWKAGTGTSLITGVQFINKAIKSNDRGDHNLHQGAVFALLNKTIGSRFFISPALRLEVNERSGSELVPQLALSYRNKRLQLRASGGKTFRDADFTERYNNYNKAFVPSGNRLGNPDLIPEHSFSYEGGADYFAGKTLRLSATLFQRKHRDLIDYITTPYSAIPKKTNLSPTGTYAFAQNIAQVITSGLEGEAQYRKTFSNGGQLMATAGFTWLYSKSSSAAPSFYIASHAKFISNFSVRYSQKAVALSLTGLYKERQRQAAANSAIANITKDYFVLNAQAEVFIIAQKLSAFVQADNVFDRLYADLLGAQMPGRWLSAGIKLSLSK